MIRDITIGQYYPAQSQVHRLDPRVKIVCTLAFSGFFIFTEQYFRICSCICISCNGDPAFKSTGKIYCQRTETHRDPAAFTVLMNLFLTRSGNILFHYGILTITEGGLRTCVFMTVRLIFLGDGIFHHDIYDHPNSLTDGIEKLLHPLNRIHVPVHEIAMMMSIALRFIPILWKRRIKS